MSRTTWIESIGPIEHDRDGYVVGTSPGFARSTTPIARVRVVFLTTDPDSLLRLLARLRGDLEYEPERNPPPTRGELTDGPPALPPAPARALPQAPIEGVFEDDEP